MKPMYMMAACLFMFAFSAYSQSDTDGTYVFSKAVVSAYHYDTKAEVFTHVFNDIESLDGLNGLPFPLHPVFLSASITGGVLTACTLWNNNKDCIVLENGHCLVPMEMFEEISEGEWNPADFEINPEIDMFSQPFWLSPIYTLDIEGNAATFTFTIPYGNGAYNFMLLGKLVITLTPQPPEGGLSPL